MVSTVTDLEIAEQIAENLRQEPHHLFRNNCFTKSFRFRSECCKRGIKAHLVWCILGVGQIKIPLLGNISIPNLSHFWGQVHGQRFETSRPLGSRGSFGVVASEIKPILTVKW